MIKPIYQIASPMSGWREVPKAVFDAPNEMLRPKLPRIEYLKRIVVEVDAEQIALLEAAQFDKGIEVGMLASAAS